MLILYDENYNFVGMSAKVLQRLGFEDLDEFSTYHKDFADLFEKENGYIYNFENFSWIDFMLYGGTDKDKAIINTKNNEKLAVRIEIEEIYTKDEILGVSKLFNINIIEESIVVHQNIQKTSNNISLSSMLNIEEVKEELESISSMSEKNPTKIFEEKEYALEGVGSAAKEENLQINLKDNPPLKEEISIQKESFNKSKSDDDLKIDLSFIDMQEKNEDTKSTIPSVSLDIEEKSIQTNHQEIKKESFEGLNLSLNQTSNTPKEIIEDQTTKLFEETNKVDEPKQESSFLEDSFLKEKDSKTEEDDEVVLNFFNSTVEENVSLEEQKDEIEPTPFVQPHEEKVEDQASKLREALNLNMEANQPTKANNIESVEVNQENSTPELKLDIFKDSGVEKQTTSIESEQPKESYEKEDISINLNFLKVDTLKTQEEQNEPQKEETPIADLNFLKTDEVVKKVEKFDNKAQDISKEKSEDIKLDLNFLKIQPNDQQSINESMPQKDEFIDQQENKVNQQENLKLDLNFLKQSDEIIKDVEPSDQKIEKNEQNLENEEKISLDLGDFIKKENPVPSSTPQTIDVQNIGVINQEAKDENLIKEIKENILEIETPITQKNQTKVQEEPKDLVINEALKSVLKINQAEQNIAKKDPKQEEKLDLNLQNLQDFQQKQEKIEPNIQQNSTNIQTQKIEPTINIKNLDSNISVQQKQEISHQVQPKPQNIQIKVQEVKVVQTNQVTQATSEDKNNTQANIPNIDVQIKPQISNQEQININQNISQPQQQVQPQPQVQEVRVNDLQSNLQNIQQTQQTQQIAPQVQIKQVGQVDLEQIQNIKPTLKGENQSIQAIEDIDIKGDLKEEEILKIKDFQIKKELQSEPLDIKIDDYKEPEIDTSFLKEAKEVLQNTTDKDFEQNIQQTQIYQTQEKSFIQTKENEKIIQQSQESKNKGFEFLPNVDISVEEKKEILKDFIEDSLYNLALIQKYFNIKDTDSIKFLAIKVKSSAEILYLNDIASKLELLAATLNDASRTKEIIEELYFQINELKQYL